MPIVAVLLWSVTYLELRMARGTGGRTIHDLLLTAIVFSGAAGLLGLFGAQTWPTPDPARGAPDPAARDPRGGGTRGAGRGGVGQALLHVLVVVQVGLAGSLLNVQLHADRPRSSRSRSTPGAARSTRSVATRPDAPSRPSSARCC